MKANNISQDMHPDLKSLLSKDIELIKTEFNADYAKLIIEDFSNSLDGALLANNFFDLYSKEGSKQFVLDFIATYLNYNEDDGPGTVYSSRVPVFTKDKQYHVDLLQNILLDAKLGDVSTCALIESIIRLAADSPESYDSIKPLILKRASEDFFLRESFEETCGKACKERDYLITHLGFKPDSMSPKLICDDIEFVHPLINLILKKIGTNFPDAGKVQLVHSLTKNLDILITNPIFATVLTIAAKNADIFVILKDEIDSCGGVYLPSTKQIFIYIDPLSAANNLTEVAHILVHESTHCSIDYAYHNYANPFHQGDDATRISREVLAKMIFLNLEAYLAQKENLDQDIRSNPAFNECRLKFYDESQYASEIPAFFIEEMAIRILNAESFGSNTRESILLNYHSPIMAVIEEVIGISYQNDINEEIANAFEAILSGAI